MSDKPKDGALRVWWIPQIPMKPYHVEVRTIREAKLVLDALAHYDLFQFKNRIKPDYSNAGGLEVFHGGDWEEWEDPDEFGDIDSVEDERIAELDAKAHLIAAAPELYAALEALKSAFMAHTNWNGEPPVEINNALAALAKANGETL
jgi:hypothetical protein